MATGDGERGITPARGGSGEVERGNVAGPDGPDSDAGLLVDVDGVAADREPSTLRNIDPDRTADDAPALPPRDIPDYPDAEGLMDIETP